MNESCFLGNYCSIFVFLLGPRLDFDPDIVAALDDDFDFDNPDNLLEDDFILQASKPTEEEEGMEIQYVWLVLKQECPDCCFRRTITISYSWKRPLRAFSLSLLILGLEVPTSHQ